MAVEVKICGLTRTIDVARAVAAGASRLGVIFAGGPRLRTLRQATELVAASEGVPVLGVFSFQTTEEILQIARQAGLSGAQLHGSSTEQGANQLRGEGLEVWRVLRVPEDDDDGNGAALAASSDLVLLEPRLPGEVLAAGGRGVPVDLDAAHQARLKLSGMTRIGLAGGLTPESLADAIRVVNPDLVDVSSGVEQSPGIKDHARLIHFLEIARDAHSAT